MRQKVRAWYEQAGLKGWQFWPVLREGTALHGEHEERWARLREQLDEAGARLFA